MWNISYLGFARETASTPIYGHTLDKAINE
jgi:hypothetical protein